MVDKIVIPVNEHCQISFVMKRDQKQKCSVDAFWIRHSVHPHVVVLAEVLLAGKAALYPECLLQ